MDLNGLESLIYGLFSGLAEVLPVSARAHNLLLGKILGSHQQLRFRALLIHIALLAALFIANRVHIIRVMRALRLAQVPKKKRKRPLDLKSMMDFRLWRTMTIPVVLAYCFYGKVSSLESNLFLAAGLIFLNGVILYVPQFLPGSNKDSRTLSRLEGLGMGLGGALSVLPGISATAAASSVGSVCGVEKTVALNYCFFLEMVVTACLIVFDVMGIAADGLGLTNFGSFVSCVVSAVAAFGGAYGGVMVMRALAKNGSYLPFAYYCWGLALFTFILNLMA